MNGKLYSENLYMLFKLLSFNYKNVICLFALVFSLSLLELSFPISIKILLDDVLPKNEVQLFFVIVIFLIICSLLKIFVGYLRDSYLHNVRQSIERSLMMKIYQSMINNSLETLTQADTDIQERLSSFLTINQNYFSFTVFFIAHSVAIYIISMSIILYVDRSFFFVLLFATFSQGLYIKVLNNKAKKITSSVFRKKSEVAINLREFADKLHIQQVSLKNLNTKSRLIKKMKEMFNLHENHENFSVFQITIQSFIVSISTIAISILGFQMVVNGIISLGEFMLVIFLLRLVFDPFYQVTTIAKLMRDANEQIKSINSIFPNFLCVKVNNVTDKCKSNDVIERIRVDQLDYTVNGKILFKNLHVEFNKGKVYTIVGDNGSGKSSLLKIIGKLTRFHSGSIEYFKNEKTIESKSILYINQEYSIFTDSIINNITLFDSAPNMELVNEVIANTGLARFVKGTSEGVEKVINNRDISGGQCQRICIARALYLKVDVLLFDEPLSGLDDVNSNKILSLINSISKDKIVIICSKKIINQTDKNLNFEIYDKKLRQIGSSND